MEQAEYTYDPATRHGRARREQIIEVATTLFHERGFHATGIDDIGAAAGITGPGIYRHFAGKDEILIAVLDRMWMALREAIDAAATMPPAEALDHLVRTHVRLAVYRKAEFTLLVEDLRFLPEDYRVLAAQNRATYRGAWVDAITGCYDVDRATAALLTGAVWRMSAGADDAMAASGLADDAIEAALVIASHAAIAAPSNG